MSNNFADLDLSDTAAAGTVVPPGKHVARITHAAMTKSKAGPMLLAVSFRTKAGDIMSRFNIMHPKEDVRELGRAQLKGMLECAGHPNPNRPGDVNSLVGLTVGLNVREQKNDPSYTEVGSYFAPDKGTAQETATQMQAAQPAPGGIDDDIPF